MALVVGQRHGDRILVLADKLSVFTGSLAGEGPSRALHHNCFTGPRDMNRLGWDAVKLRERALDGFATNILSGNIPGGARVRRSSPTG
jgi:hypothetical protein